MSRRRTVLVCAVILLAAGAALAVIFLSEPTAERGGATKETAMLVEVVEVERGTYRPVIAAMGTVVPAQDIVLSPRVEGEIVSRADAFRPGGLVEKGEVLLTIDPSDYRNVLAQRRSDLEEAIADLELEKGRQDVARQDFELLDDSLQRGLQPENRALVLRRPQLETATARVASTRAAVEQAELDLGRTTIRAPFDAHILSRDVNVGSQVAPGHRLGRLVGVDTYWVEVAVPLSKLRFLSIPDDPGESGSLVRIRNRSAWPEGVYRTGHVTELLGELADRTRMARVLVSVSDPLARGSASEDVPPLIIGSYVEARIEAEPLRDVVRLDRDAVRQNDTVWLMEDGELAIRDVEIVFRDAEHAYIGEGLEAGDRVVTSNLSTVVEGAPLRLEGERGG